MPLNKLIVLTTTILILALLSAGCTDTGGGSVESPTPDSSYTTKPTQERTPISEPTATEKN